MRRIGIGDAPLMPNTVLVELRAVVVGRRLTLRCRAATGIRSMIRRSNDDQRLLCRDFLYTATRGGGIQQSSYTAVCTAKHSKSGCNGAYTPYTGDTVGTTVAVTYTAVYSIDSKFRMLYSIHYTAYTLYSASHPPSGDRTALE